MRAIDSESENERLLDNPIWSALRTDHAPIALGGALARGYPADIGPLSGIAEVSPAAFEALATLAGNGGMVVLFFQDEFETPPGWTLVRGGLLSQMVCASPNRDEAAKPPAGAHLRRLNSEDVPQMVALAELTEPGPFRTGTIELGGFHGAFEGERLVAMAGQRTSMPGFVEVSAVCTHPDVRGKGYARTLMSLVMDDIREMGKTPYLHSFAHNDAAIRVYEALGFMLRRHLHLGLLRYTG